MKKNLTVIDLGTNTIRAAVAKHVKKNNKKIKIQALKYIATKGLKYGKIINFRDVENSLLETISAVSDAAQEHIRHVIISLPPWVINSQIIEISNNVNQTPISTDLIRLMKSSCMLEGEEIIHVIPIDYSLDGESDIKDPRGMTGKTLSAIFHTLSVKKELLDSFRACLSANNINVKAFVSSPLMSSQILTQDTKSKITVIDIGGSCTSITCINDGIAVYSKNIPIGGEIITQDISAVLKIDMISAERLKILHGLIGNFEDISSNNSLLVSVSDDFGSKIIKSIPHETLSVVIASRLDELLENIRTHLLKNNIDESYYQTVLFTGGGSSLLGLEEYIRCKNFLMGSSISIAKPTNIIGSDDSYITSPSFSAVAGTILYGFEQLSKNDDLMNKSLFSRIKSWFKGNF